MQIAIATVATPRIYGYAQYSLALNAGYAAQHGYSFHVLSSPSPARHPSWGKIEFAKRLLPLYDWLFVMDADAVFVRPERKLEQFTELDGDLLVCKNGPNGGRLLNAGVMMLRNTPAMQLFLPRLYDGGAKYAHRPLWEQDALNDLIEGSPAKYAGVRILPLPFDTFNSYFLDFRDPTFQDRFVLHMMASKKADKERVFRQLLVERIQGLAIHQQLPAR